MEPREGAEDRRSSVPLRLPAEEMRALGHQAVDEIVRHLETLDERPVTRPWDRRELDDLFDIPLPEEPGDPRKTLAETVEQVRATMSHPDHPRMLAFVPGPGNFVGAVADFVAAGLNAHVATWVLGPGPAVIERVTIGWLCRLAGLPERAGGLFLSGGTMASLVALHAARRDRRGDTVYVTGQTHAAIRRGLGFLGFDDDQVRTVEVDGEYRMDPRALERRVTEDASQGRRPFCVVATAGTTSTGAVDPLPEIADVCARHGLWLHVDGAYGAAATIVDAPVLEGLDRADSIALDPHKWLFQPYESACLLVRDESTLVGAYAMDAEYLRENRLGDRTLNMYDYGPEASRGFRALKLWLSLRTFGLEAFRRAVRHGIALAEHAEAELAARPEWEIVTPARLGIVTFRPRAAGRTDADIDALTRELVARGRADGFALVLSTELDDRPVLRICAIHPETTHDDLTAVITRLQETLTGLLD